MVRKNRFLLYTVLEIEISLSRQSFENKFNSWMYIHLHGRIYSFFITLLYTLNVTSLDVSINSTSEIKDDYVSYYTFL